MLEKIARTPIARVPTHLPICVREDATIVEAVIALKRAHKGAVVVQDAAGRVVGVFTERTALRELSPMSSEWHLQPVSSVMGPANACVGQHETVAAAIEKMNEHGVRYVPAVDDDNRAIGIISSLDLLAFIAEHFPRAFMNLPPRRTPAEGPGWGTR